MSFRKLFTHGSPGHITSRNLVGVAVLVAALTAGPLVVLAEHAGPLVPAQLKPGNFVSSSDSQVCFDIFALSGKESDVTSDMVGFKIDPPADFSDTYVSFDVSADGKSLSWTASGATVLGVIVKGGSSYNLYDYYNNNVVSDHDNGLNAPLNRGGQQPQISHYNVCYVPNESDDINGCSKGYWKNHADRWSGVSPLDDFDTTFGVNLFNPDVKLGTAINLGGGINEPFNQLAAQATAALLNANGGTPNTVGGATVNYPYTAAEVRDMVQTAATGYTKCLTDANTDGTITKDEKTACRETHINPVKDAFDEANNEEGDTTGFCPLTETTACKVSDFLEVGKCP